MLHELHVIEVDDTRVVLVHRGDLGHFVVGEAEVEDVQVLRHTFLVARLRDGHDAALREQTQGHLRGGFAIVGTDAAQHFALDDAVDALSAQRTPCHHLGAELVEHRLDAALLYHCVALQLVDHRLGVDIMREVEETGFLEVAHADGAHLAVFVGLLHRPPRAEHVAVGLVDEQQVDVVGLELAQALVNALGGFLFAGVRDPHLGDEEEVFAF